MKESYELIIKMTFGSYLYGTSLETSDKDYTGVFIPPARDIIMERTSKHIRECTNPGNVSKNGVGDIDLTLYSLREFVELGLSNEIVALDMLYAPESMWLEPARPVVWNYIVGNRDRFISSDPRAMIGYAKRQAARYGLKAGRLSDAKDVLEFLRPLDGLSRLIEVWPQLLVGENSWFDGDYYIIVGKKLNKMLPIREAVGILDKFVENYGKRAQEAADNKGVDWKAIMHALRATYQVQELYKNHKITLPRPTGEAMFLRHVRTGTWPYKIVSSILEDNIDYAMRLSEKTDYPKSPDRKFWDGFLYEVMAGHLLEYLIKSVNRH